MASSSFKLQCVEGHARPNLRLNPEKAEHRDRAVCLVITHQQDGDKRFFYGAPIY